MIDTASFAVSHSDHGLIRQIAERATRMWGGRANHIEVAMDITATHANGCPLDLKRLLEAKDFDFAHDIVGIGAHLDRETGKISDHFWPRHAAR